MDINCHSYRVVLDKSTYLEEESHDKHLQGSHADDETNLNHAKVHDSLLCTGDGGEIAVLARSEVLLVPRNGRKLTGDFEDGVLDNRCLLGGGSLLEG